MEWEGRRLGFLGTMALGGVFGELYTHKFRAGNGIRCRSRCRTMYDLWTSRWNQDIALREARAVKVMCLGSCSMHRVAEGT
jgi:hypothetical protein